LDSPRSAPNSLNLKFWEKTVFAAVISSNRINVPYFVFLTVAL